MQRNLRTLGPNEAKVVLAIGLLVYISPANAISINDRVVSTTNGLNIRSTPNGASIGQANTGNSGTVVAGPASAGRSGSQTSWASICAWRRQAR